MGWRVWRFGDRRLVAAAWQRRQWSLLGERKKKEPEGVEETDSRPQVHLSARESTVLSGTTSVFFLNLEVIPNLYPA